MVEMLETRLMPSSLQGLGQAHRERLHHPKQAQPIQPETLTNPGFEHAQFASLSADDCVPSGCCSETDPGLPPGVKNANQPPIQQNGGFIANAEGFLIGFGSLKNKKLNPLDALHWQQLGATGGCATIIIQLPLGGFGVYHLGNGSKDGSPGMKGLNDFLNKITPRLGGNPPECIRVIPGSAGDKSAHDTCADLIGALNRQGIAVPRDCIAPAPTTLNPKSGLPQQDQMWVDPNGEIHFFPPSNLKTKTPAPLKISYVNGRG